MADFETLPAGSRRAMELALEALEFMADEWGFTHKANRPERWQAIQALRAALAEPEEQHQPGCALLKIPSRGCDCQPEQEPVPAFVHRELVEVHADGTETWSETPLCAAQTRRGPKPADHFPTGGKMVTVEELFAALGWPGGISTPLLDKAVLLHRVSDLAEIGRRVLTALDHGWIDASDQVADDLRSVLTPPADERQNQEPSITAKDERSCLTCAHMLKSMLEEPCVNCMGFSQWKQSTSVTGAVLRWFGWHRATRSE